MIYLYRCIKSIYPKDFDPGLLSIDLGDYLPKRTMGLVHKKRLKYPICMHANKRCNLIPQTVWTG